MSNITIGIRVQISVEDIENLMYSMAQGSNYWCKWCGDLGYEITVKSITERGLTLKLEDFEDEDAEYSLNFTKIKKGLAVMAKKVPEHFADILEDNADAVTADVLLQCALFGEVKYG